MEVVQVLFEIPPLFLAHRPGPGGIEKQQPLARTVPRQEIGGDHHRRRIVGTLRLRAERLVLPGRIDEEFAPRPAFGAAPDPLDG